MESCIAILKDVSKKLSTNEGIKLTLAQCKVAQTLGYIDWQDLDYTFKRLSKHIDLVTESVFDFTPRSSEKLKEDVKAILADYLEDSFSPKFSSGEKEAEHIIKSICRCSGKADYFALFDSLGLKGVGLEDVELLLIYQISSSIYPATPFGGHPLAERVIGSIFKNGFNKKEQFALITKSALIDYLTKAEKGEKVPSIREAFNVK